MPRNTTTDPVLLEAAENARKVFYPLSLEVTGPKPDGSAYATVFHGNGVISGRPIPASPDMFYALMETVEAILVDAGRIPPPDLD